MPAPEDDHLFIIAEAFRRGWTVEQVARLNQWHPYFYRRSEGSLPLRQSCRRTFDPDTLQQAKRLGYADREVARLWGRHRGGLCFPAPAWSAPGFKMVDTCAGEYEAATPYFYSSYDQEDEGAVSTRRKVVSGAGPIRIGQGIEFDYCSVHAVRRYAGAGVETSSSITIRRRSRPILIRPTGYILNR